MITALIILSISLLITIVLSIVLVDRIMKLTSKLKLATDENRKMKETTEISSSRGIIKNQSLSYHSGTFKGKSLTVDYEIDILEITDKQFKVKATNFDCSSPNYDMGMDADILGFMDGKWVDKKDVNLIMDEATKRNLKLEQLLG